MHARILSRDSQAKLIVRSVAKLREFRRNKKIATTVIGYARLTQHLRNPLNRSRTGIRPDLWTDLNGCQQRLLFARQLTQRKCSLCSQGREWTEYNCRHLVTPPHKFHADDKSQQMSSSVWNFCARSSHVISWGN